VLQRAGLVLGEDDHLAGPLREALEHTLSLVERSLVDRCTAGHGVHLSPMACRSRARWP
jgi:hypothetical protein